MFGRQFVKYFNTGVPHWSTTSKSNLAKLRKKTGYTFTNCKKALEVNNNDLVLAEKWLKEQAQALGWAKASKLEGRKTLQGLVGVIFKKDCAVMLEVNCETDFVARNKKFYSFVDLSTQSCLQHLLKLQSTGEFSKTFLGNEELKRLVTAEGSGKTLADHTALTISSIGENLNLRRAVLMRSSHHIHLSGYTHPSPHSGPSPAGHLLTGRYGALVAYKSVNHDQQVQQVASQLCQHIVGMNPSKIGATGVDEPQENKDEEVVMIHQEFLCDPSVTVGEVLTDMGINVLDYVRFECGESLEEVVAEEQDGTAAAPLKETASLRSSAT